MIPTNDELDTLLKRLHLANARRSWLRAASLPIGTSTVSPTACPWKRVLRRVEKIAIRMGGGIRSN